MSETVTTAKLRQYCELCGQMIRKGEPIRIIRDDFMPGLTIFEHVRCPGNRMEPEEKKVQPFTNQLKPKTSHQGA